MLGRMTRRALALLVLFSLHATEAYSESLGTNWTLASSPAALPSDSFGAPVVAGGKLWITLYPRGVYNSTDGKNWFFVRETLDGSNDSPEASFTLGDEILAIGLSNVWRVQPPYVSWTKVIADTWFLGDIVADPSYAAHNGEIYILGGNWLGPNPDRPGPVWASKDGVFWETRATNAPWGMREGAAVVSFGGKLWLMGGFRGGAQNDVWSSVDGSEWTLELEHAPWTPRALAPIAAFKGRVWLFGYTCWSTDDGVNWRQETLNEPYASMGGPHTVVFKDQLYLLGGYAGNNNASEVWRTSDGSNFEYVGGGAQWSARSGQASLTFNGKVFMLGGENSRGPQSDVWSTTDGAQWTRVTAAAPWAGRRGHTALVHNGYLWVIGGADRTQAFADVWRSPDGENWEEVSAEAAFGARYFHGAASLNGQLWVASGLGAANDQLGDVWASRDGITWELVTPAAPWGPRFSFGMVAHQGELWIAGGENQNATHRTPGDVWHSADGDHWTQVDAELGGRVNPALRSYAGRLWLASGWQYYDTFRHVNVYANDLLSSADGQHWTVHTEDAPWDGRRAPSMEFLRNKLIFFAGDSSETGGSPNRRHDVWVTSGDVGTHSADSDYDLHLSLDELLRGIQLHNSHGYHCQSGTEDDYAVDAGPTDCLPHATDYAPQDWAVSLDELLRLIQFYNTPEGYHPCPEGEDGFCLETP